MIMTAQPRTVPENIQIRGVVKRRIFFNPDNGYCVLTVSIENEADDIKVTGHMTTVREGDEYVFKGTWMDHPKFGRQFKFSEADLLLPSGRAGVARYLAGITYGVGIKKAEKIVNILGDDALEKIKADPTILEAPEFGFLTKEQRQDIIKDLTTNSVQAELAGMLCRPGSGIGMKTVAKIISKYGKDALRVVKENPYVLSQDIFGVGFLTADTIAQAVGIEPNSPFRVEAAINYLLKEAGNEGHVYLRPSEIVERLIGRKGLLEASGVDVPDIARANQKLIDEGRCVREGDNIYSTKLYLAEKSVAAAVRELASQEKKEISDLDAVIADLECKYSIEYAPEQKAAIRTALEHSISVITGGPGTGKSEITRAIVEAYLTRYPRHNVYLCAPTGRAAKRLEEATSWEASTIHRLLKYRPETGGFEHHYNNPLPGPGLLVIDEVSMMDIELAAVLFPAARNLQVILVGDIDQLPSVGPGSVLRDIIASGRVPTTRLQYNYRQARGSKIAELANMVCRGEMPPLVTAGDFEFVPVENGDQATEVVLKLVAEITAAGYGPMDWAVLAPMRRGTAGVTKLNERLRELVNPADPAKPKLGQYRQGDKVMVIQNDYNLGVYNGDLGIVQKVDRKSLWVDFGDKEVEFPQEELDILTLAYASTIHKSQGSEFPIVIMPLVQQHYVMLQRNLLYTGMTRAKKKLILVAEERSVRQAVRNDVIEKRNSLLTERIRGAA